MRIAVVGSGIAGISAAYYLSKAGHSVSVFDQEKYAAMKTSRANGGQISVCNSEVWNTWSNIKKGIKWMADKQAPLHIGPLLRFDKLRWLAKFLIHTLHNDHARNTVETIKLGLNNRKLMHALLVEESISFDYTQSGILHIYKDSQYFQNAVLMKELFTANGCEWNIISVDKIRAIEPNLTNVDNLIGGVWTPSDSVGDMHVFCINMVNILKRKYKVNFYFNKSIKDVSVLLKDFDRLVIASGVAAQAQAKQFGDNLDIYPVKGYSITIDLDNESLQHVPKISILDDEVKIVSSTLGNKLRVAGTAELAGNNLDITRARIEPLLNWVHKNFPHVNTENYNSWTCLRPMTPNMMPIIRPSKKNSKVFYHCGHGHLGWTTSLATAKNLSELIG